METFVHAGLTNAAVATGLAALAALATFLFRQRPAIVHVLWLLVLLKLLTPPLVTVPVSWPAPPDERANSSGVTPTPTIPQTQPGPEGDEGFWMEAEPPASNSRVPETTSVPPSVPETANPTVLAWTFWYRSMPWVWLAGSTAWFAVAVARAVRFQRLLRYARPAPASIRAKAAAIADELGLRRCPPVLLVPGRLAPMLWAFLGPPRLLLPERLLAVVGPDRAATLLAHELAHLRRRDHWVRGVEFLATGLYWWHPAVWFACRALREAEEQCCDAWVVSTMPGAGRSYAAALVETLDFLSAAPPALPPLASGVGQVSDLKRRLTMILRGKTPRALGWGGALAVLGLASLLPLVPAWARAGDQEAADNPAVYAALLADEPEGDEPQDDNADALKKAQAEIERAQAELQKKLAEVQMMRDRLHAVAEKTRAEALEQAAKARKAARDESARERQLVRSRTVGGKEVLVLEGGTKGEAKKMVLRGTIEVEQTPDGKVIIRSVDANPGESGQGPMRRTIRVETSGPGDGRPGAPPGPGPVGIGRGVGAGGPPGPGGLPAAGAPASDRRMREMERRLESLQRELESLRREMSRGRPGARSVPSPNPGAVPVAEVAPEPPAPAPLGIAPVPRPPAPAAVPAPPSDLPTPPAVAPLAPSALPTPPAPPSPEDPRATRTIRR